MRFSRRTAAVLLASTLAVSGGVLATVQFDLTHMHDLLELGIWLFCQVAVPLFFVLFVGIEPHTKRLYWRTKKVRQAEALEATGGWIQNCHYPSRPAGFRDAGPTG